MSIDQFAQYDAAYVLGALSPEDRLAFEAHLETCTTCADGVRDLAGLPGLMARVPLEQVLAPPVEQPPATVLPSLSLAVRRERRRRRWVTAAGLAAAAVLAVGAVAVVGSRTGTPGPARAAAGIPMTQVVRAPLHASARFVDMAWGTRIDLTCTYDTTDAWLSGATYALVVVDRTGGSQQVATWTAVPGKVSTVMAASSWKQADMSRIEIRTMSGQPVLQLRT